MTSPRSKLLAALGLLLLAIAGCQIVAGIENRTVNPLNTGCVLPAATSGGYNVRIANLAPTSDQVDVCMRPAGKSDWGLPILLNGGVSGPPGADGVSTSPSCTDLLGTAQQTVAGFVYGQVSVPIGAPAATIDVKMIPGGSGCSAGAIAEQDGVALSQTVTTTLMLVGGNGVAETVEALPEADQSSIGVQVYRFVHASPGLGPIDFGTGALHFLPTSNSLKILSSPIAFGGTAPAGSQTSPTIPVLDNGYVSFPGGNIPIVASLDSDPSNKALLLWLTQGPDLTFSMYVIGVQGDNNHPLRALVCEEDQAGLANSNGVVLPCSLSPLATLSVDTFNTALYGPNAPQFTARESQIPAAIASRTSDVMCVVEVDFPNDMQSIISAGADANQGAHYPYSYAAADKNINASTPFTNPKDQNGNIPPAPTQPPCAGVSTDTINAAISCMEQYCSNQPAGDGTGELDQPTSCIEDNCAGPILQVEGDSSACFDCVVLNVAGETSYGTTQTQCTTNSQPPIAFNGAENSVILSRYPLVNTDVLILPSTFYRRSILYAQVQLEDQTVDLYCGFLMTTENATVLPYVGSYGNGATDSQTAWNNEQTYEAQQFAQWVQQKSGSNPGNPAIMVGDWHSSYAVSPDAGTPPSGAFLPNAINTPTMDVFKNAGWTLTLPSPNSGSTWQPQCNDCPIQENPYNGSTDQYFFSQPMLVNWPQASTATTDQSLFFTNGVVSLGGADAGEGPLSTYYGVSVDVLRPK